MNRRARYARLAASLGLPPNRRAGDKRSLLAAEPLDRAGCLHRSHAGAMHAGHLLARLGSPQMREAG